MVSVSNNQCFPVLESLLCARPPQKMVNSRIRKEENDTTSDFFLHSKKSMLQNVK